MEGNIVTEQQTKSLTAKDKFVLAQLFIPASFLFFFFFLNWNILVYFADDALLTFSAYIGRSETLYNTAA